MLKAKNNLPNNTQQKRENKSYSLSAYSFPTTVDRRFIVMNEAENANPISTHIFAP
ncbi:hypothetical protein NF867_00535 [Solitalea sp. MAHUQ-68]|uniref:Uncharacterized protein n=1 Tax=Solitalea agri TaxID=2953739 RepID=A0A9X2F2V1_9SPHI|nr:hypothetical protein [Solitalea agri]MCO4291346.1 hypothetical protein [Solitalea agri]